MYGIWPNPWSEEENVIWTYTLGETACQTKLQKYTTV